MLKTDAKVSRAKLAGILLMIPNANIQIEGHTDSTGSEDTNSKLSAARAQAVTDFLKSHGVEESRMVSRGLGPAQPVADNATADGRAKNRRVEIVVPEVRASAGSQQQTIAPRPSRSRRPDVRSRHEGRRPHGSEQLPLLGADGERLR